MKVVGPALLDRNVNVSSPAFPRTVTASLAASKVKLSLLLPPLTVTSLTPAAFPVPNNAVNMPVAVVPSNMTRLSMFSAVDTV